MCFSFSLLQAREGEGFVTGAVVGHHAGDRHAEAVIGRDGGLEKGDGALGRLVRQDARERDAGGVVEADVDELQPAPSPRPRGLDCRVRSPVMRWPTWWKRPIFLTSILTSSPNVATNSANHSAGPVRAVDASWNSGSSNMPWAANVPRQPPTVCATA